MKPFLVLLFLLLSLFGLPNAAFAHAIETNYFTPTQFQLDLQVQFSTGEKFKDAPVKVYAPKDATHPWLEGKTNAQGEFAFQPDRTQPGDWTVKIGQSDHADILTVPVTATGVNEAEISQGLPQPNTGGLNQMMVLGFAISSGIGTQLFLSRRKQ